jgi:predicted  nucleic acid-binding Zn-ribbon protein
MSPLMSPQEQVLVALQDLDLMLKEAEESQEQLEKLGFDVSGVAELRKARAQLTEQLDHANLAHYERMAQRYGRAVSPVTGDMCLGCFAKIPTVYRSSLYEGKVRMCQSCSRILYFP